MNCLADVGMIGALEVRIGDTLDCDLTRREVRIGQSVPVKVRQILLHPNSDRVREAMVEGDAFGAHRITWVKAKFLHAAKEATPSSATSP